MSKVDNNDNNESFQVQIGMLCIDTLFLDNEASYKHLSIAINFSYEKKIMKIMIYTFNSYQICVKNYFYTAKKYAKYSLKMLKC